MSATIRYLDQLSARLGGVSDYRLAQELGLTRQSISGYRRQGTQFDARTAWRCAELLELNPADVIAAVELDRAKTPNERAFWQRVSQPVAACLALAVVGVGCVALPEHAFAAEPASVYYVKLALVAILLAASFQSAANSSPMLRMRNQGL